MKSIYKTFFGAFLITLTFASCEKNGLTNADRQRAQITLLTAQLPQVLTSVYFTDEQNGFVGGAGGGLYKTSNGGSSWQTLNSTVTLPVYGLFFVNSSKGFAVGGESTCGGTGCTVPGGFILRTLDGGKNWQRVYTPSTRIEVTSVYFVNDKLGFCVGNNIIFKTANGGDTWTEQTIDNLGGKMMQIKFTSQKKGYIICLFDKIVQTNDGGNAWTVTSANTNLGYYSLASAGGTTYVAGQGKIIKSTDEGHSWNTLANAPSDVFALDFKSANNGIAFGRGEYSGGEFGYSYAAIYTTVDGGSTWTGSSKIDNYAPVYSASFPGNGIGYGTTRNQVIKINY